MMVHHAGKNGQQRGTSRREDALDLVLALRRPFAASAAEGARVHVVVEKCRGAAGDLLEPFEARLETIGEGGAAWSWRAIEPLEPDEVIDSRRASQAQHEAAIGALLEGETVSAAADLSGLSRTTVGRIRRMLVADGMVRGRAEPPPGDGEEGPFEEPVPHPASHDALGDDGI
jgi:hypothetical protein